MVTTLVGESVHRDTDWDGDRLRNTIVEFDWETYLTKIVHKHFFNGLSNLFCLSYWSHLYSRSKNDSWETISLSRLCLEWQTDLRSSFFIISALPLQTLQWQWRISLEKNKTNSQKCYFQKYEMFHPKLANLIEIEYHCLLCGKAYV